MASNDVANAEMDKLIPIVNKLQDAVSIDSTVPFERETPRVNNQR